MGFIRRIRSDCVMCVELRGGIGAAGHVQIRS